MTQPKARTTSKPYLKLYEAFLSDRSGRIRAVWFNLESLIYVDTTKEYVFFGKLKQKGLRGTIESPIFTTFDDYKKWGEKLGDNKL